MALTEERQEQSAPEKRRPDISQVLEGLGILLALGTLALGVLGTIPEHQVFEVGREVFGNIPAALQVVFYVSVAGFLWLMLHLFARRAKGWSLGIPERRSGLWGERVKRLSGGLMMKTLMRDPRAGLMHSLYYGFLVLFLGTVTLEIDHILPSNLKFLHGASIRATRRSSTSPPWCILGGLALFTINRYLVRPGRIRTKTKPEDALILVLLALIGVTGLLTEAARISLAGRPDFEVWSFVGYPLVGPVPIKAGDRRASGILDRPRRCLRRLPRRAPRHQAPAHVHVAGEHVPLRPAPAQRARCGRCPISSRPTTSRPSGRRWSPISPGSRSSTPMPAPSAAAAPRCARPTSPASRSTHARSSSRRVRSPASAAGVSPPVSSLAVLDGEGHRLRAGAARGGVRLHHLPGLRRDLPGQHRDPRPHPRHAPLSHADGVRVPERTGPRPSSPWRTSPIRGA